jgi:hypothetical protein
MTADEKQAELAKLNDLINALRSDILAKTGHLGELKAARAALKAKPTE